LLRRAFDGGINAPVTSSVGRLFDAAAALVGTALNTSYEAEAAMRLEALCSNVTQASDVVELPLIRDAEGVWRSDWAPLLTALLDHRLSAGERAALFHESLARTLFHQALVARQEFGVNRIGLAGGVFQNRLLTERARFLLAAAGFEVLIPRLLPVNDAAISFGQIIEGSVLARRPRAPQASTKVANEPLGFV
jgi:hydrogenase maturation protein HypF